MEKYRIKSIEQAKALVGKTGYLAICNKQLKDFLCNKDKIAVSTILKVTEPRYGDNHAYIHYESENIKYLKIFNLYEMCFYPVENKNQEMLTNEENNKV